MELRIMPDGTVKPPIQTIGTRGLYGMADGGPTMEYRIGRAVANVVDPTIGFLKGGGGAALFDYLHPQQSTVYQPQTAQMPQTAQPGLQAAVQPAQPVQTGIPQPEQGQQFTGAISTANNRQAQMDSIMKGLAQGGMPQAQGLIPGEVNPNVADDITINAKKGEFVIPQEVVSYLGSKFFENIVSKSRKELGVPDQQGPKTTGQPDAQGRMDAPGLPQGMAGHADDGEVGRNAGTEPIFDFSGVKKALGDWYDKNSTQDIGLPGGSNMDTTALTPAQQQANLAAKQKLNIPQPLTPAQIQAKSVQPKQPSTDFNREQAAPVTAPPPDEKKSIPERPAPMTDEARNAMYQKQAAQQDADRAALAKTQLEQQQRDNHAKLQANYQEELNRAAYYAGQGGGEWQKEQQTAALLRAQGFKDQIGASKDTRADMTTQQGQQLGLKAHEVDAQKGLQEKQMSNDLDRWKHNTLSADKEYDVDNRTTVGMDKNQKLLDSAGVKADGQDKRLKAAHEIKTTYEKLASPKEKKAMKPQYDEALQIIRSQMLGKAGGQTAQPAPVIHLKHSKTGEITMTKDGGKTWLTPDGTLRFKTNDGGETYLNPDGTPYKG